MILVICYFLVFLRATPRQVGKTIFAILWFSIFLISAFNRVRGDDFSNMRVLSFPNINPDRVGEMILVIWQFLDDGGKYLIKLLSLRNLTKTWFLH